MGFDFSSLILRSLHFENTSAYQSPLVRFSICNVFKTPVASRTYNTAIVFMLGKPMNNPPPRIPRPTATPRWYSATIFQHGFVRGSTPLLGLPTSFSNGGQKRQWQPWLQHCHRGLGNLGMFSENRLSSCRATLSCLADTLAASLLLKRK